jgi:mRNA-degrading endonuclease toxin of MazEF toxin-antitoxin module
MSDDTEIRRGDVVIVRLDPAEGHEMRKTRPAVVVQNDVGNKNSKTTIVAPATGTYRSYPFEVLVEASDSPFEKGSRKTPLCGLIKFESCLLRSESIRWLAVSPTRQWARSTTRSK